MDKKQSLLHVGTQLRDRLEQLAQLDGERWQDLARQVLTNYVNMKALEVGLTAALTAVGNDPR